MKYEKPKILRLKISGTNAKCNDGSNATTENACKSFGTSIGTEKCSSGANTAYVVCDGNGSSATNCTCAHGNVAYGEEE
jgi:hypothetical protein